MSKFKTEYQVVDRTTHKIVTKTYSRIMFDMLKGAYEQDKKRYEIREVLVENSRK